MACAFPWKYPTFSQYKAGREHTPLLLSLFLPLLSSSSSLNSAGNLDLRDVPELGPWLTQWSPSMTFCFGFLILTLREITCTLTVPSPNVRGISETWEESALQLSRRQEITNVGKDAEKALIAYWWECKLV